MPAQLSTVEDPTMPIILTIDSEKIESALRKLEAHEPLTVFGVQVRAGVRAVLNDQPCPARANCRRVDARCAAGTSHCVIDTAEQYKSWLSENNALLNDPEE
jgi:hypothetical protein